MKADIDGAARIARIASEFGWTWTDRDVARFCEATQWSIVDGVRGSGPTLQTNLDVHQPRCHVVFTRRFMDRQAGGGGGIDEMRIYVADSGQTKPTKAQSAALHHQLRERLAKELGPVSEYVFGEDLDNDYWRFPKVVITVAPHDDFIQLDLVNPRYQRCLDEEGARDFMYDGDEEEDDEDED
ncbi:DUF6301 family protein [Nocardia sp. CA-136227]|uniref:DUF6301 family protein n=1 Tax=Nocardia sp. CA-136227 TaxID=3239979 RepID=UPI003D98F9AF